MALSPLGKTKLSSMPKLKTLLLKAAFKKSRYDAHSPSKVSLPSHHFYLDGIELDKSAYNAFHQVVGWDGESDTIHPCYLHSLAFALHIKLLLLPTFPFPLLGLVHVNNQIRQIRPIRKDEKLAVSSCFGQLELHPKGWLFSIEVEFYSGSEFVWKSTSTNLFRTKHGQTVEPTDKYSLDSFTNSINETWTLSSGLGRQYAKVSGDYNPIHLTKWSAKLFGFKQHIIHGMWTKSYCISALQKINPTLLSHAYEVNTTFKQPLYLPNQVNMAVQNITSETDSDSMLFQVEGASANNEQPPLHLIGNVRSI
jgi:acyl dehydratase